MSIPTWWEIESYILFFIIKHEKNFDEKYKIKSSKDKDILFIFGSGSSLKNISDNEWTLIENHSDTMAFNDFFKSEKIRIDYHICREFSSLSLFKSRPILRHYFSSIFNFTHQRNCLNEILSNSKYKFTKFIFHIDRRSGSAILFKMFSKNKIEILGYYSNCIDRRKVLPLSNNFKNIPHCSATLMDCIHIGFLLGYRNIVLAGVDLYNSDYFYLNENEVRQHDQKIGHEKKDIHKTAPHVINGLSEWLPLLTANNIHISILNPNSLLNGILPVFNLSILTLQKRKR